ncbi:hypothetical protein ACGF3C_29435 [Micromonospora sp. NPDC047762]|uniref:hypothetical protein n=1 Tax=unclassified Micromonospora TaxID=2617518 RepID=UPI0033C18D36
MAQRIPTTAGLLESIDERTCLLHTGGESLENLAARFTRAAGSAPGRVAVHPGADVAVGL